MCENAVIGMMTFKKQNGRQWNRDSQIEQNQPH